jgi:hypothetical protein
MYACMCPCINCVCMYVCMHACRLILYVCTCMYVPVCMNVCMYVCMYVVFVSCCMTLYACLYVTARYVCMYVCMCMYVCVCMYVLRQLRQQHHRHLDSIKRHLDGRSKHIMWLEPQLCVDVNWCALLGLWRVWPAWHRANIKCAHAS